MRKHCCYFRIATSLEGAPQRAVAEWVDTEVSDALMWDRAQVQRLARHLGYLVAWPEPSLIPLADQVRAAEVDVVVTPSPQHLSPLEVNGILYIAEIENISPRLSFARWTPIRAGVFA